MKSIKKINNNFCLAIDSQGEDIIVRGKGIGFIKMPCEIDDLSIIERTYYGVDSKYIDLLNDIPEEIFNLTADVVDYARNVLDDEFNPNMVFTLADHIQFSIQRYNSGMKMNFPFQDDFLQLYEAEVKVGKYALNLIKSKLDIQLDMEESIGIAINIINSKFNNKSDEKVMYDLISDITGIIEKSFNITIDKESINYSRLSSHLRYLFKRIVEKKTIESDNLRIFQNLQYEFKNSYRCALEINKFLNHKLGWELSKEEILYLILHINRICSREDCYRKGMTPNK